jgi:hypothetical protein
MDHTVVERIRRYRQRKREGGVVFTVDLDGSDVAALVKLGLLAEDRRRDRDAVKAAFAETARAGYRALTANAKEHAVEDENARRLASLIEER